MPLLSGPIPLYYQLYQDLTERIQRREFKSGDLLPTEERLCAEYGVSRITVRRALDSMLANHLITRRRGVGTFVSGGENNRKTVRLVGVLDDALSYTKALSFQVLSRKKLLPPGRIATALALQETEKALCIEIVASLQQEPFVYSFHYFPIDIGEQITTASILNGQSILRILENNLGYRINRATQAIEPLTADSATALQLGIKPKAALLQVLRIYYTASNQPVQAGIARYHPDRYNYTVELVPRGG